MTTGDRPLYTMLYTVLQSFVIMRLVIAFDVYCWDCMTTLLSRNISRIGLHRPIYTRKVSTRYCCRNDRRCRTLVGQ